MYTNEFLLESHHLEVIIPFLRMKIGKRVTDKEKRTRNKISKTFTKCIILILTDLYS